MNSLDSIKRLEPKSASLKQHVSALLIALAVMLVVSCATTPAPSNPPSIAPTISCRGRLPAEHLPAWVGKRPDPSSFRSREQYITALEDYSAKQTQWAILAAGAYGDLASKRGDTADCLDTYRAAGVIH